jgi:hypothetical protein
MRMSLQLQEILSSSYNTESKHSQIKKQDWINGTKKGFPIAFVKRLLIMVFVFGLSSCQGSPSREIANQSILPTFT